MLANWRTKPYSSSSILGTIWKESSIRPYFNQLLILIKECLFETSPGYLSEWIECWVHVWGRPSYVVSEGISRLLASSTRYKHIQTIEILLNGHRFYCIRTRIMLLWQLFSAFNFFKVQVLDWTKLQPLLSQPKSLTWWTGEGHAVKLEMLGLFHV